MKNDKQMIPEIRFPGFTDPWEQRKVSEIADRYDNLRVPVAASERVPGSTPYYGANGIQDYVDGYTHDGEFVLIAEDGANDLKNYPVQYATGKIWVNNHAHVLQGKEKITDNKFLGYSINATNIESLLVGGGRAKLNAEVMMGIELLMPSYPEQCKISELMFSLDNLITLHQRKCDGLRDYKNGLLQQMFPMPGESTPRIRFPGFTDPWEQRKCEEIFDKVGNPVEVIEKEVYREIGIRSHGKGIFHKDEVTGKELGNKRVFWVEPNCFVVNIVFAWERAVAKTTDNENGMIASHRFPMYRPKVGIVDLDYITRFFTTNTGKAILEMASPGGAGRNKTLGQKEFANSKIWLPSYEEQRKIGRLIDEIDNAITLHQRKCDELKTYKKGLLQKIFV